jgi:TolB-like protein
MQKMHRGSVALVVLGVAYFVPAQQAQAAGPVVAVMPFRDLVGPAGGRAPVGEALRETITVDLAELPGLKVVERATVDKIIAEQELETRKRELSDVLSVRVGTLLGATLLVTGAYQRSGARVRLTARAIDVASGEIRGSAKVDGDGDELLGLQDRLAAALFQSAGLPAPAQKKLMARRTRAKVPYHAFELYGDAVVAKDDVERRRLLQQAVATAPQLIYATRDLEALQQRMGRYAAVADARLDERERQLVARADDLRRSPAERAEAAREALAALAAARRYTTLAETAVRWQRLDGVGEPGAWSLFRALDGLRKSDAALGAGERYLAALPTGEHYREIETRMHEIVEVRRKRDARRAEYESDLADKRKKPPGTPEERLEWDWAPCICARWNAQINELMLSACANFITQYRDDRRPDARDHVIAARFFVILALTERGEFKRARPLAAQLLADSDEWDEELRKLMATWPTD